MYSILITGALLLLSACQHIPAGSEFGFSYKLPNGQVVAPTFVEAELLREEYFENNPDEDEQHELLINGTVVPTEDYPHVIRIFNGRSSCTASVVGPRAILTAAHCGENGDVVQFKTVTGKSFKAKLTRAPIYPQKDLDIALGYVSENLDVKPVSVLTERFEQKKMSVDLIGYGCTRPDGSGGNDGLLRAGKSVITNAANDYDLELKEPGGAALCYGDSGGPTFIKGKQNAVNSKGNIKDVSWVTRLTNPDPKAFLMKWASDNGASICGLNVGCDDSTPPPPPPPQGGVYNFKSDDGKVTVDVKVK